MAGDEDAALRVLAVRQRKTESSGRAERCGDAGHDVDRNAVCEQQFHLLSTTPENEGISALEPDDAAASTSLFE